MNPALPKKTRKKESGKGGVRLKRKGGMNVVIFVTAANKKEADKIASALIKNKLAACVNIIGDVDSLFRWQGKVDKAKEALLIVKTRRALMPELIKKVKALHSYAVPEIIALPIVCGNKEYLEWLNESTG